MNPFALEVINVNKLFENHKVLDNINLSVEEGEFVSILGPSGCGKTTLLRIIAGLDSPSMGQICIRGNDVTQTAVWKRRIGMVFQSYALWPHRSVFRNVSMGLELKGLDKASIQNEVIEALKLVQLDHLADRLPAQLSGGQRQRVALARAIALKPNLLLLDEPLSALDKNLRQSMQVELKRLHMKTSLTTIMVTHDQEEAMGLSDRVVVLESGELKQMGSPSALYYHPNSVYVAEFVGDVNFFSGTVDVEQGRHVLRCENGLTLSLANENSLVKKADVIKAFVRPEWITLTAANADADATLVKGTVEQIMFLGSTMNYWVKLGNQRVLVRSLTRVPGAEEGKEVALNMTLSPITRSA